jgi:hypothetical protein
MTACIKESTTQHYLGDGNGFGPVKDGERVLFAVFEDAERDGLSLTGNSFEETHLKRDALSLARNAYITKSDFDANIIVAGIPKKGRFIGIAAADVSHLRSLRADVQFNAGSKTVRSLCVLDRVQLGDFDAHATAGYCEEIGSVGQKQLGKLRAKIRMDLANTFLPICDLDSQQWPSKQEVALACLNKNAEAAKASGAGPKHNPERTW